MADPVGREGAPRGPYKNGLKRRREIVEAAALVFGQYGYHGGSLRTIAEMVGTTPATLVSHFTSKEGLLAAVLEYWRDSTDEQHSADDVGLNFFRAYIPLMRYHVAHRGFLELFLTMATEATQLDHPARPFIVERQRLTMDTVVRELNRAIESGQVSAMTAEEVDIEAVLTISVLDGAELQWLLSPSLDLEGIVRHHIDAALARWTGRSIADVSRETTEWLRSRSPRAGEAAPDTPVGED